MNENMKAFVDAIQNNEELGKKFEEISDKEQAEQKDYTDEYLALAKEYGVILTKEDFQSAAQELSDEDLENVSGGFYDPIFAGMLDAATTVRKLIDEEKAKQSGSGQGEEGSGTQN